MQIKRQRYPFSMLSEDREGMAVGGDGEVGLGKMRLKQLVHGFGRPLLQPVP